MPRSDEFRWLRPGILLEIFVLINLGFLTFDIYLAHSVNELPAEGRVHPFIFFGDCTGFAFGGPRFSGKENLGLEGVGLCSWRVCYSHRIDWCCPSLGQFLFL